MREPVTGPTPGRYPPSSFARAVGMLARSKLIRVMWTVLKIGIGLAMLWVAFRQVQQASLVTTLRSANIGWLCVALLSVLLGLGIKLWRWAVLLRNYQVDVSISRLFSAFFVGQAANILLPFRGGELVRLGYFADQPANLPEVASSIVLEKYLDLLALTMTGFLVSTQLSIDHLPGLPGWLLPLVSVLTVVLIAAILVGPRIWSQVQSKGILPERVENWLARWVDTSMWLRNPRRAIPAILLTTFIWMVMWATNLLLFQSLGIRLGASAAGLVLVLVYVGLIPALMPGNLGPFYFFAELAVIAFGIFRAQALSYAVVLHAIVTLPPLVCGAVGLIIRPKTKVAP